MKTLSPRSKTVQIGTDREIKTLLGSLCRAPKLHARFLNTLSLLEHIGSRKILLSQTGPGLKADALRHLAEETRHAHFFRHAAEMLSGKPLTYSAADTFLPASSRRYLGRLDALITRELGKDRALAYFYVSLAVEIRARWFYGFYEYALNRENVSLSLRGVLAEEDAHLSQMESALKAQDPLYPVRRARFMGLESQLFSAWWERMKSGMS